MKKRTVALLMCLVMVLGISACGKPSTDVSGSGASTSAPEASQSQPDLPEIDPVNVMVMTGPTGVGAAQMMMGTALSSSFPTYNFTVVAGNDEVAPALAKGEVDIACIATPVATACTMFATRFDRDPRLSVNLVSLSTLLSMVTLPLAVSLTRLWETLL